MVTVLILGWCYNWEPVCPVPVHNQLCKLLFHCTRAMALHPCMSVNHCPLLFHGFSDIARNKMVRFVVFIGLNSLAPRWCSWFLLQAQQGTGATVEPLFNHSIFSLWCLFHFKYCFNTFSFNMFTRKQHFSSDTEAWPQLQTAEVFCRPPTDHDAHNAVICSPCTVCTKHPVSAFIILRVRISVFLPFQSELLTAK